MYKKYFKRPLDFLCATIGFLILSPIFILCCIFLLFANRRKVFFTQQRPGKNERIFKIIKFKTMNDAKDSEGNLLSDSERLTKVGQIARKTSLDELPQLLNVIIGDMSLIGPRPLLQEYLPLYNDFQKQRHNVRPGITGWAQVNGRNAISWEDRFRLDIEYVKTVNFVLDIKIISLTMKKVVLREGINADSSITMSKFEGNA